MSHLQRAPWARPEERGRFWLLTSLRDLVDRIAAGSPARLAVISFAAVVSVFSFLLWLPVASAPGVVTPVEDAVFTATSAVTVTGLTTVSTAANCSRRLSTASSRCPARRRWSSPSRNASMASTAARALAGLPSLSTARAAVSIASRAASSS